MSVNTMKITLSFITRLLVKLYFLILPNTNIWLHIDYNRGNLLVRAIPSLTCIVQRFPRSAILLSTCTHIVRINTPKIGKILKAEINLLVLKLTYFGQFAANFWKLGLRIYVRVF